MGEDDLMAATTMTEAEWEAAVAANPTPVQCHRCGRWLFSKRSILRGYGAKCAFLQALEELSRAVPYKRALADPTVHFEEIEHHVWSIRDRSEREVGRITLGKDRAWWISVWGDTVDFDKSLVNAKVRAERIFLHMR